MSWQSTRDTTAQPQSFEHVIQINTYFSMHRVV
jgi:hypothetical protein